MKKCDEPEEGWPDEWNANEFEFVIKVTPPLGGPPVDLCADGWNRAMPMRGTWNERGRREDSISEFSFACNGAVAVKCLNWTYEPWGDAHQACTRMASADYCGDGTSNTIGGTLISLYDRMTKAPQGLTPIHFGDGKPDADFSFEAGWLPNGAECLRGCLNGEIA
jgi:hypothetical protein